MQTQRTPHIQRAAIVTGKDLFFQKYRNFLASRVHKISKVSWEELLHIDSPNQFELLVFDNELKQSEAIALEHSLAHQVSPCHIISIGPAILPRLNHGTLCISLPSDTPQNIFDQFLTVLENVHQRDNTQLELASMLLHDIRSPLNSLVGYLELLINGTFGKLPNGHINIVEKAIDMSDYALDLIEELSDVFKYEQKFFSIQKETINFSKMLDTLLAIIWIKADKKNLKIKRSIPADLPEISGDEFQIQRLTSNLLTNAINHAPENSSLSIQVKRYHKNFVKISITDEGKGVPEDTLPHLFEKYYRLQNNSASKSGQGLGLYISKIITEAHGGEIWAENQEPSGLTIHFTLPLETKT